VEAAAAALESASANEYFRKDHLLPALAEELNATSDLSPARRIEIGRRLEARSLSSPYVTRSRKRDVMADRVVRNAVTLPVNFSPDERQVYAKNRSTAEFRKRLDWQTFRVDPEAFPVRPCHGDMST